LEGKKETHDSTDQEESSQKVYLTNLLLRGELAMFSIWILEEEKDDSNGNASEG
jgi:hypothetical protein